MIRINLFRAGEYLLLTPRGGEWPLWAQIPVLLLLCAVPLALIIWLYRYEMKIIARGVANTLLLLRIVVAILILVLVCLQPTYARDKTKYLSGRVIVAVDVSESMKVLDPQRPPEDKLRLAMALKLHEGTISDQEMKDWIRQHSAKKAIAWVGPKEHADNPKRRRLLAKERQEKHDALIKTIDALTREEIARRVLSTKGLRLLDQIKDAHLVDLYAFALNLRRVNAQGEWQKHLYGDAAKEESVPKENPKKPEEKKPEETKPEEQKPIDARYASTNVSLPLIQALHRSGAQQGKILGVVVVTDGQHNLPSTPLDQAAEMGERKIPLYPIAIGARKAPPDVAILGVSMPPSVFQDVDVNVTVRFRVVDLKEQDLKVTLYKPGDEKKTLKERTIKHDGKDQEYYETFQVRLKEPGAQMIKVKIEPQGKGVKETDLRNNERAALVNVAKDKADVLVIDGEARWEFHYLHNALLRDRSMKVKSVVYVQPRLGNVPKEELEKMDYPSLALPKVENPDEDPLFKYDCIILGDVTPTQLPLADRKRLERYVADRGGTLVLLAGKKAMPLDFRGEKPMGNPNEKEEDEESLDPLYRMLPIEKAIEVKPINGFRFTLTQEGRMTPYLQLEPDATAEENELRWSSMRKHYWGVIGKAKPGATTLAYVSGDEKNLKPEEKRKLERDRSLVVAHNYGFGQVLYVGVDSTWRWRYRVGDTYHHRFWGQTIRWAASDKPLVAGNRFLRFGAPKPIYRPDEKVEIMVRLEEALGKLPPKMEARARIYRKTADGKDEQVAFVPLSRKPLQPRAMQGEVPQLLPGEHYIELDIPDLKDKLKPETNEEEKLRAKFTVASRDDGEMVELSTNYELLKQMATKSGSGKVYTPETAQDLVKLLKDKSIEKIEHKENNLWQWWPMLALIILLLSIEWVLRKLSGLP